jgi:hypothetical protein
MSQSKQKQIPKKKYLENENRSSLDGICRLDPKKNTRSTNQIENFPKKKVCLVPQGVQISYRLPDGICHEGLKNKSQFKKIST